MLHVHIFFALHVFTFDLNQLFVLVYRFRIWLFCCWFLYVPNRWLLRMGYINWSFVVCVFVCLRKCRILVYWRMGARWNFAPPPYYSHLHFRSENGEKWDIVSHLAIAISCPCPLPLSTPLVVWVNIYLTFLSKKLENKSWR